MHNWDPSNILFLNLVLDSFLLTSDLHLAFCSLCCEFVPQAC